MRARRQVTWFCGWAGLVGGLVLWAGCGGPAMMGEPDGDLLEDAAAIARIDALLKQFLVSGLDLPSGVPDPAKLVPLPLLGESPVATYRRTSHRLTAAAFLPGAPELLAAVDVADSAAGSARIREMETGMTIDLSLVGARDVQAKAGRGHLVYEGADASGARLIRHLLPHGFADSFMFDVKPAEEVVRYDVALDGKVAGVYLVGKRVVEFVDAAGVARVALAPPVLVDSMGSIFNATVEVTGCTVMEREAEAGESHLPPRLPELTPPGGAKCRIAISFAGNPIVYPALLDPTSAVPSGNGITWHGGPVMTQTGPINVYYIWYGAWSKVGMPDADTKSTQNVLTDLVKGLKDSPYWKINRTYADDLNNKMGVTSNIVFAKAANDDYSQGMTIGDAAFPKIVTKAITGNAWPADTNSIYVVLTSKDVKVSSGFCKQFCGYHTSTKVNGTNVQYAFIGDPTSQCLSGCSSEMASPNGNAGADAMASVVVHELAETATDPFGFAKQGWYDASGYENADKCAWTFGTTYKTGNSGVANVKLTITGGSVATRDFLLQQNWINANRGKCVLQ